MIRALSLAVLLALLPDLAFAQAPAAVNGGVYLATPPSLTNKQAGQFQLDSSGNLKTTFGGSLPAGTNTIGSVNQGTNPWTVSGHIICDSGCGGSGGTSSNFSAAFPATGTAAGASFGGNMVALTSDGTNLNINCVVGCAGGTFNNNADTVATSATNGQSASWPYVWNGSSWDRLYGDKTNGAFVNVKNASLAVTGTFWQATQPVSGTFWQATQPVSGTFWQATQPVSGTVAATQSGTWSDRMQDGAGTALTSTGSALDVNLKTSSITLPVSGTFWQATQPVSGTVTANQGGAPWSENISQIGGASLALGQTTMSASVPVAVASNQSTLNVACLSGCSGTTLGQANMNNSLPVTMAFNQSAIPVYQGALTAPWVENLALSGKQISAGQQTMQNSVPVALASNQPAIAVTGSVTAAATDNLTQIGGANVSLGQTTMNASLPVTIASNQGAVPIMQAPLSPPLNVSVANSPLTPIAVKFAPNTPMIAAQYADPGQYVSGAASSTSNTAVTLIAAQARPVFITGVQCGRSDAGTAAMIVTLSDTASTILVLPNGGGGGGNNLSMPVPLRVRAGAAFTFTPGTSVTTAYCNAQGYLG